MEQDNRAEAQDAIRNLVLMLASLTMCGHTELKPSQASMGSLFQMLGFTLPQPSNRGNFTENKMLYVLNENIQQIHFIYHVLQEEAFEIFKRSKYYNLYL